MGLRGLINAEMPWAEVIEANNPNEALAQIRAGAFDLTLVGTDRARLGSLAFLKLAREAAPGTRFAVISASDTRADILATLAAGFHGFISKHQSDTDILFAITEILSGRIYVPGSLAEAGDGNSLNGQASGKELPTPATAFLRLTKRQREVLSLLARGKSNKEIARSLNIAEATTKIHLAALLRALGVRNRTEAAFKAAALSDLGGSSPPLCPSSEYPGLRRFKILHLPLSHPERTIHRRADTCSSPMRIALD